MATIRLKCGLEIDARLPEALATARDDEAEWKTEQIAVHAESLPGRGTKLISARGIRLPPELMITFVTRYRGDTPDHTYIVSSLRATRPGRIMAHADEHDKFDNYGVPNERIARMAIVVELNRRAPQESLVGFSSGRRGSRAPRPVACAHHAPPTGGKHSSPPRSRGSPLWMTASRHATRPEGESFTWFETSQPMPQSLALEAPGELIEEVLERVVLLR
jgi:hypothetical protein